MIKTKEADLLLDLLSKTDETNTLKRANAYGLLNNGTYIDELRQNGYMIVGTTTGYYLTDDKQTYVQYCQKEESLAKRKVGKWSNRIKLIQQQEETLLGDN